MVTNQTPREAEMTKRRLCRMFKENDLKISVEANKKVADFLDITLDLSTGSYKPYKKPDDIVTATAKATTYPQSSKICQKV